MLHTCLLNTKKSADTSVPADFYANGQVYFLALGFALTFFGGFAAPSCAVMFFAIWRACHRSISLRFLNFGLSALAFFVVILTAFLPSYLLHYVINEYPAKVKENYQLLFPVFALDRCFIVLLTVIALRSRTA
jgi:hydrogenase-4 membrane subunit HyfE